MYVGRDIDGRFRIGERRSMRLSCRVTPDDLSTVDGMAQLWNCTRTEAVIALIRGMAKTRKRGSSVTISYTRRE